MIYCYYVNGSNSLILAYNLGDEINEKCLRFKALGGDGRTITPKYHKCSGCISGDLKLNGRRIDALGPLSQSYHSTLICRGVRRYGGTVL
jgi:hypothetical protein